MRLSPVLAHAVLGAPSDLGGTLVTLDDLWGREAMRIQEQLCATSSWDERFAMARIMLARRHDEGRAADPEVVFVWRQMLASRGQARVESLAAEAGWSRKRLWSRFRSQIGITPKRAAQLIRFDHAAHRLAAGQSAALVAEEAGYADQSHLHHDVMAFAGLTPTAVAVALWLAGRRHRVDRPATPIQGLTRSSPSRVAHQPGAFLGRGCRPSGPGSAGGRDGVVLQPRYRSQRACLC